MSRREQREAKRAQVNQARANLVKWRAGWYARQWAPALSRETAAETLARRTQAAEMVAWLDKQIADFDARSSRNKQNLKGI